MAAGGGAVDSRLGFSIGGNSISFELDNGLYPLEAVYGACYLFLDRCYVHLSKTGDQGIEVRLTAHEAGDTDRLDTLAGEFTNELLSQSLRGQLSQSTARIREFYTAAALRAATTAPSVDDLLAELESEDLLEDPLEIMVPWEEKHGGEQAGGSGPDGKPSDG